MYKLFYYCFGVAVIDKEKKIFTCETLLVMSYILFSISIDKLKVDLDNLLDHIVDVILIK